MSGYPPGTGTGTSYPTAQTFAAGDDVWMMVDVPTAITVTASAGWTKAFEITLSTGGKTQLWHYGPAPSSTWSAIPSVFTVSSNTTGSLAAWAVRGGFVDTITTQTITGAASSPYAVTPTLNAAATDNVFAVGFIYGGQASGGNQQGPDYYPAGTSQNGWTEIYGNAQGFRAWGFHGNQGTLPATLPTFGGTVSSQVWGWAIFTIRKNPSGWSVGQIRY
jgi:hypothetical protein